MEVMSKYEPVSAEVVAALQTALGAEYVKTDAETLEKYKTDEETEPVIIICRRS